MTDPLPSDSSLLAHRSSGNKSEYVVVIVPLRSSGDHETLKIVGLFLQKGECSREVAMLMGGGFYAKEVLTAERLKAIHRGSVRGGCSSR